MYDVATHIEIDRINTLEIEFIPDEDELYLIVHKNHDPIGSNRSHSLILNVDNDPVKKIGGNWLKLPDGKYQ